MPPSGKLGHKARARKRSVFNESFNAVFNIRGVKANEIIGTRKKFSKKSKKQEIPLLFAINKKKGNKKERMYFWNEKDAKPYLPITTRGLAKAQFWEALKQLGGMKPARAFVGVNAEKIAKRNTRVMNKKALTTPSVRIDSTVKTADRYRHIAIKVGIRAAGTQIASWAKRLEKKQKDAWK